MVSPMLRSTPTRRKLAVAWGLVFGVGVLAAALVQNGNPGNMGLCGACFLRDTAGAVGLISGSGPKIFRPELLGLVLGALGLGLARRRYVARSGSFAVTRFSLGVLMAFGTMVFLGCPFRMLQRLGGGDLNAAAGLAGFVVGVGGATLFEKRGYSVGKTAPAPAVVGLWAPITLGGLFACYLVGNILAGPAAGDRGGPAHAPWAIALGLATVAGVVLSLTGFCAISAVRQLFRPGKGMLVAALLLVAGYTTTMLAAGSFRFGAEGQPVAHQDALWNALSLALVGITGAFAGGCPVRQLVMAGEGNGDAWVTCVGLLTGGALAHNLQITSTAAGPTPAGRFVTAVGIALVLAYAAAVTRGAAKAAP